MRKNRDPWLILLVLGFLAIASLSAYLLMESREEEEFESLFMTSDHPGETR